MDMADNFKNLSSSFYRVITKFRNLESRPRDFGIEEKLYPSEIHMIQAIGVNRGINVTDLAGTLGITKGAVPKMTRKLENKGLVKRHMKNDNRKEVYWFLTEKGKTAFDSHENFHAEMDKDLNNLFASLDTKEKELVFNFLGRLEKFADSAETRFTEEHGEER
jgi:DNA-binding MarR family transcriptional regulator